MSSEKDIKKILEEASKGKQGKFTVQDCGEGANYSKMYKVTWWREDLVNKQEPAKKKVAKKTAD
tara:strand:- start:3387 stop:3578 length:192 start_codon:yes stop_codon:yes gene_type:complete